MKVYLNNKFIDEEKSEKAEMDSKRNTKVKTGEKKEDQIHHFFKQIRKNKIIFNINRLYIVYK